MCAIFTSESIYQPADGIVDRLCLATPTNAFHICILLYVHHSWRCSIQCPHIWLCSFEDCHTFKYSSRSSTTKIHWNCSCQCGLCFAVLLQDKLCAIQRVVCHIQAVASYFYYYHWLACIGQRSKSGCGS